MAILGDPQGPIDPNQLPGANNDFINLILGGARDQLRSQLQSQFELGDNPLTAGVGGSLREQFGFGGQTNLLRILSELFFGNSAFSNSLLSSNSNFTPTGPQGQFVGGAPGTTAPGGSQDFPAPVGGPATQTPPVIPPSPPIDDSGGGGGGFGGTSGDGGAAGGTSAIPLIPSIGGPKTPTAFDGPFTAQGRTDFLAGLGAPGNFRTMPLEERINLRNSILGPAPPRGPRLAGTLQSLLSGRGGVLNEDPLPTGRL